MAAGSGQRRRGGRSGRILVPAVVSLLVLGLVPARGLVARADARAGARSGGRVVSNSVPAASIVIPDASVLLASLRPGHPRLQLTAEDVVALRARIAADPATAAMYAGVRQRAQDLLAVPPVVYVPPSGSSLLETCREALRRLQTLGLAWLIDGDPQIAQRGWDELHAINSFPDWNPAHFLDTGELTHAASIGLDWLFDALTPAQRTETTDAIRTKGLGPARDAYDGTAPVWYAWWSYTDHNWNQVTNGGIAIGALAVADVDPALAAYDLHEALVRVPKALAHYAPDGGWPEGVSYWLYATEYTVYLLSALDTALGTNFAMADVEGFDRTGEVPIYMSGPSGQRDNWADDGEPRLAPSAPLLFWLADRFGRAAYRDYELAHAEPSALDVVWYRPSADPPEPIGTERLFSGVDVATLRGAIVDPDATWTAFKGGYPQFNHNQLDIGTFVIDAKGQRWAMDLGRDDYDLPGYFDLSLGGKRWTYYRNRAEGHNTLVIDPGAAAEDQWPRAKAHITSFATSANDSFGIVDMSPAYPGHTARRGVRLLDQAKVLVQDEVASASATDVWWFMHTRADVQLADGGRTAILSQNGQTVRLRILAPSGSDPSAVFSVMDAVALPGSPDPAGQTPNTGVRKLAIHRQGVTSETIAVLFEPDASAAPVDPPIVPLDDWAVPVPPTTTTTTMAVTTTTPDPTTTTTTAADSTTTTAALLPAAPAPTAAAAVPITAVPAFTG